MESQDENQQYPLMKGKLKFLRRSLTLGARDEIVLKKIRQKGLYVKCVKDFDVKSPGRMNLRKDRYLKGKLVNCLQKVVIRNSGQYEWYNVLKYARNIKTLDLQLNRTEIYFWATFIIPIDFPPNRNKKSVDKFLQCLKKLPKGAKHLGLDIDELKIEKGHLKKVYRLVGSFRNLEKYKRRLGFNPTDESYVFKELLLIKKYCSKVPELLNFRYNPRRHHKNSIQDQHEFLAVMKYGRECPWITDFWLQLEPDLTIDVNLKEETSVDYTEEEREKYEENQWEDDDDYDEDGDGDDDDEEVEDKDDETEEEKIVKLKEETSIFFRFNLFPNLQKLVLQFHKGCFYPLDDFVVKGFRALTNLRKLGLLAKERPQGMKFLFEGMLEVPLLDMINLKVPFIKSKEWELLERFFNKQNELETITLDISKQRSTKEGYLEQNKNLAEYFGGYLSKKPNLKYVILRGKLLTVEALSEALKKVEIKDNQLKNFNVSLFDDHLTPTGRLASERGKGLCDFIISQKESLRFLSVDLLFVLEAGVVQELTRAISQMEALRMLDLFINADRSQSQYTHDENIEEHLRFFKKVLKKPDIIERYSNYEDYFVDIAKMLKELKTVDNLGLFCFFLHKSGEELKEEFIEILKAFPEMKQLRNIYFNTPFRSAPKSFTKEIEGSLLKMKDLKTIGVAIGGYFSIDMENLYGQDTNQIVDEIYRKQQLRSDLMFS